MSRQPLTKPRHPRLHPDRFNECQMALEDRVLSLLGDAVTAGWDNDEVLAAIIEIADNTNLAMSKDVLLTVELARFRKRKDV